MFTGPEAQILLSGSCLSEQERTGGSNWKAGDADVQFVYAQGAGEKICADGFGVKRYPVMYNDIG